MSFVATLDIISLRVLALQFLAVKCQQMMWDSLYGQQANSEIA